MASEGGRARADLVLLRELLLLLSLADDDTPPNQPNLFLLWQRRDCSPNFEVEVLAQIDVFSEADIDAASEALNDIPLKKLYMLIEMAAQGEHGGKAEAIYSGQENINIAHFYDCLQDIVRF